jgi:hypothetical protein
MNCEHFNAHFLYKIKLVYRKLLDYVDPEYPVPGSSNTGQEVLVFFTQILPCY